MKSFYMRQKVFSISDKYNIYDDNNNLMYYCKGQFFSLTSKLRLYSNNDNELFYIRKKFFSFLPKYQLFKNEEEIASVYKRFTLFHHTLNIESSYGDLQIEGDFWAHDFQILNSNEVICEVHKMWLTFGDSYCITIHEEKDYDFLIALVILIDNCLHNNTGATTTYSNNN